MLPRLSGSIRTRLIVGTLASLFVVLGAAAVASYTVGKHEAEEIFDARLATSARVLEALIARQMDHATITRPLIISLPPELEAIGGEAPTVLGHPYETKIAFQVWRDDGTLLARSAAAPEQPFGTGGVGFSDRILNGEQWQVFVLQSGQLSIHVAENDDVRNELVSDLGLVVMAPLAAGALLLVVVINLLIIRGFAPLRELARRVQSRAPGSLGRIELGDIPEEVALVVDALNDLLARLALAFEHERRFTDDAAHELRTPLAALRIHADNLVLASNDEQREQSLARLRQGLDRAIKLSEQMLLYSRVQNGAMDAAHQPVRLLDIVSGALAEQEPLRRQRGQRVRLEAEQGEHGEVLGDAVMLQRLVGNLLDNASRYAPQGADLTVRLYRESARVVLSVSNPGRSIAAELRQRVFEPYYRVPGSASQGSGLGLAISREIAGRHGASITLDAVEGGQGTCVTVRFPALPGPAVPASL